MNNFTNFSQWLTPSVSFEFIKHFSTTESAGLIAAKTGTTGTRFPLFLGPLQVKISSDSKKGYAFTIKRTISTFFVAECRGVILPINEDYSQIEGLALTSLALLAMLMYLVLLGITGFVVSITIISVFNSTEPLLDFMIFIVPLTILFIFIDVLTLYSYRWVMIAYTDMILGTLLHTLSPTTEN